VVSRVDAAAKGSTTHKLLLDAERRNHFVANDSVTFSQMGQDAKIFAHWLGTAIPRNDDLYDCSSQFQV